MRPSACTPHSLQMTELHQDVLAHQWPGHHAALIHAMQYSNGITHASMCNIARTSNKKI